MAYNPYKEVTPVTDLGDSIMHIIDRRPDDIGANWNDQYELIEMLLLRHDEVANCAVDYDGQTVYVALSGDLYDVEDLERIDALLRQTIGRVACFNFN